MKSNYKDIVSRIKENPQWYDIHGTPRYDKFHPELSPNIYAKQVILLEISCQYCQKRFLVEMNWGTSDQIIELAIYPKNKFKRFEDKIDTLHYGDPPNHSCVGDTMNCEDLRIVEFWDRKDSFWHRLEQYEIIIHTL